MQSCDVSASLALLGRLSQRRVSDCRWVVCQTVTRLNVTVRLSGRISDCYWTACLSVTDPSRVVCRAVSGVGLIESCVSDRH